MPTMPEKKTIAKAAFYFALTSLHGLGWELAKIYSEDGIEAITDSDKLTNPNNLMVAAIGSGSPVVIKGLEYLGYKAIDKIGECCSARFFKNKQYTEVDDNNVELDSVNDDEEKLLDGDNTKSSGWHLPSWCPGGSTG